jgi:LysM repeat protein
MSNYRIRAGDTLSSISQRFKVGVTELANANGIENQNKIRAGKVLHVPDGFSPATPKAGEHRIRAGETLSTIAQQHHVSVTDLANANGIKNQNKIFAGDTLKIPGKTPSKPQKPPKSRDSFDAKPAQGTATPKPAQGTATPKPAQGSATPKPAQGSATPKPAQGSSPSRPTTQAGVFRDEKTGRTFPNSNGYPRYYQGDAEWGSTKIGTSNGKDDTIKSYGCALASIAMGLSGITGQTLTPGEIVEHMNKKGAMTGNFIANWGAAGSALDPQVKVTRQPRGQFGANQIDKELAQGRPVVVGVDFMKGSGKTRGLGHDGATDHWILITGKGPDGKYLANDPIDGKAITLHREGNRLVANPGTYNYRTTGDATTFGRGPARGATTPATPSAPSTPAGGKVQGPGASRGVSASGFKSIEPSEFLSGGGKSKAAIVVGTSEGNRTPQGGVTGSYWGHEDPVNKKNNLGSFSVQGGKAQQAKGNPARADQIQIAELTAVTPRFEAAARKAGLDPHNALLLATYYDMQTQSPATAYSFLRELPALAKTGVTVETLIDARVRAFHKNGTRGGYHDTPERVEPDARRRIEALVTALRAQGLTK